MPLQRDRFLVYFIDPTNDGHLAEREAVITQQDMMRAEAAVLGTPGLSLSFAFTLTTAWCWASLMRQGDYAGAWQQFRDEHCQGFDQLDPVDVDPTQPGTTVGSP